MGSMNQTPVLEQPSQARPTSVTTWNGCRRIWVDWISSDDASDAGVLTGLPAPPSGGE